MNDATAIHLSNNIILIAATELRGIANVSNNALPPDKDSLTYLLTANFPISPRATSTLFIDDFK